MRLRAFCSTLRIRYMVGVYDKSTKKVKLYKAPTHLMSRTVKALKNRNKPAASTEKPRWREQLNSLGEAFGSKKAITKIRAAERNEIDVAALQGVASHVQHDIDTGTTSLPSRGKQHIAFLTGHPEADPFYRGSQGQYGECATHTPRQ